MPRFAVRAACRDCAVKCWPRFDEFREDVGAFVKRADGDLAALRLAGCQTPLPRLDAVVDRVSQEMQERFGHLLEQ